MFGTWHIVRVYCDVQVLGWHIRLPRIGPGLPAPGAEVSRVCE